MHVSRLSATLCAPARKSKTHRRGRVPTIQLRNYETCLDPALPDSWKFCHAPTNITNLCKKYFLESSIMFIRRNVLLTSRHNTWTILNIVRAEGPCWNIWTSWKNWRQVSMFWVPIFEKRWLHVKVYCIAQMNLRIFWSYILKYIRGF